MRARNEARRQGLPKEKPLLTPSPTSQAGPHPRSPRDTWEVRVGSAPTQILSATL